MHAKSIGHIIYVSWIQRVTCSHQNRTFNHIHRYPPLLLVLDLWVQSNETRKHYPWCNGWINITLPPILPSLILECVCWVECLCVLSVQLQNCSVQLAMYSWPNLVLLLWYATCISSQYARWFRRRYARRRYAAWLKWRYAWWLRLCAAWLRWWCCSSSGDTSVSIALLELDLQRA